MGEEYAVGGLMMASRANMLPGREPNGQAAATKEVGQAAVPPLLGWSVPDARARGFKEPCLFGIFELVL